MKLTAHNARVDSSGLHNDRQFDLDYAPHIDRSKVMLDQFWTYNGESDKPLNEIELDFYKKHFLKSIKEQNRRNVANGHRERNRTLKQFYKADHTRPEDKILQLGNKNEHPDPALLWECALEYQRRFDEIFGENCKILDMSLHLDEATPHVHIRRVWMYEDENGIEKVGQTKALEKLGILEKDTSREKGRYNNPKMTFTAQERQLFRDICKEKGLELEDDAPSRRKHLSVQEYKDLMDDMQELEHKRDFIRNEVREADGKYDDIEKLCDSIDAILTAPVYHNIHDEEVREAKRKSLAKRAAALIAIMKEEAEKIEASEGSFQQVINKAYRTSELDNLQKEIKTLNHKVEILNGFIIKKGLGKELVDYLKNPDRSNNSPHRTLLE